MLQDRGQPQPRQSPNTARITFDIERNDEFPIFFTNAYSFEVNENVGSAFTFGQVSANDADANVSRTEINRIKKQASYDNSANLTKQEFHNSLVIFSFP